jgi:hypothetical protein
VGYTCCKYPSNYLGWLEGVLDGGNYGMDCNHLCFLIVAQKQNPTLIGGVASQWQLQAGLAACSAQVDRVWGKGEELERHCCQHVGSAW